MSLAEIINELPKLSENERRAVRQKLLELATVDEEIRACNEAALQGALILDRLEEPDGRGAKG